MKDFPKSVAVVPGLFLSVLLLVFEGCPGRGTETFSRISPRSARGPGVAGAHGSGNGCRRIRLGHRAERATLAHRSRDLSSSSPWGKSPPTRRATGASMALPCTQTRKDRELFVFYHAPSIRRVVISAASAAGRWRGAPRPPSVLGRRRCFWSLRAMKADNTSGGSGAPQENLLYVTTGDNNDDLGVEAALRQPGESGAEPRGPYAAGAWIGSTGSIPAGNPFAGKNRERGAKSHCWASAALGAQLGSAHRMDPSR